MQVSPTGLEAGEPGLDRRRARDADGAAARSGRARVDFIDIARGLGILLVVLGHSGLVLNQPGEWYEAIFSFHMPLFFLLSGLFFKPTGDVFASTLTRGRRLLLPYAATLILLAPLKLAEAKWSLPTYTLAALYASGRMMPISPLWFLPHLFLLTLLARGVMAGGYVARWPVWARGTLLAALLVLGVLLMRGFADLTLHDLSLGRIGGELGARRPGLPLSADIALVTLPFFLLGTLARSYFMDQRRMRLPTLLAVLVFLALHVLTDVTLDLNIRRYDSLLLSTVAALAGSQIVIGIATLHWPLAASRVLRFLGRHSLVLLCFHQPLLLLLPQPVAALTGWTLPWTDAAALLLTVMICSALGVLSERLPLRYFYGAPPPVSRAGKAAGI